MLEDAVTCLRMLSHANIGMLEDTVSCNCYARGCCHMLEDTVTCMQTLVCLRVLQGVQQCSCRYTEFLCYISMELCAVYACMHAHWEKSRGSNEVISCSGNILCLMVNIVLLLLQLVHWQSLASTSVTLRTCENGWWVGIFWAAWVPWYLVNCCFIVIGNNLIWCVMWRWVQVPE